MSCEVAATVAASPYEEPLFSEEEWKKCVGGEDLGGLEAIAEFNESFGSCGGGDGCGIDPTLLSNASSPASGHSTASNGSDGDLSQAFSLMPPTACGDCIAPNSQAADLNQAFSPFPPTPSAAYPDLLQPSPAPPPFLHHSIESKNTTQQLLYHPSLIQHQFHRRSVSEPPVGFPDHTFPHKPPPGVTTTFTRSGFSIGTPKRQYQPRNLPKGRPLNRHHPYPTGARRGGGQEGQYQVRRTQMQPMRVGPTSVPPMRHVQPPPQQVMFEPVMPSPPQYTSSRVCTPAPSPEYVATPVNADPFLDALSPVPGPGHEEKKAKVAIPLGVDELRAMIVEAVQNAVKEMQGLAKSGEDMIGTAPSENSAVAENGDFDEMAKEESRSALNTQAKVERMLNAPKLGI